MDKGIKIQVDEIPAGKEVKIGLNTEVDQNCSAKWKLVSSLTSKSLIFGNLIGWHQVDSIRKDNDYLWLNWEGKKGTKEIFNFRINTPVKRGVYNYIIKPILFPLAVFARFCFIVFGTRRIAYD